MEKSYVNYPGDGSTSLFNIPFDYMLKEHVHVYVDGEEVEFSFLNRSTATVSPAPVEGSTVSVRRETPAEPQVDFRNGTNLTEEDLDTNTEQYLFIAQEGRDWAESAIVKGTSGTYEADGSRLAGIGAPVNASDAVNRKYIDDLTEDIQAADARAKEAENAALLALLGTGAGFDTFAQMAASTLAYGDNTFPRPGGGFVTLNISAGNILVTKEGGRYEIAPLGTAKATMEAPSGYHISTDGGLLLRVLTKGGEFWLSHFGAVLDRTTDDADALEMMFCAIIAAGGGKGVVDGKALIERPIINTEMSVGFHLRGLGWNLSEIKTSVDDIGLIRFVYPNADPDTIFDTGVDAIIEDISFVGAWKDNNQQSEDDNWLVHVNGARYFNLIRCRVGSSQKGGVKGWGWGSAQLIDCEIYECARGGWNVSRSMHTFCRGNIFRAVADDAISLHTPAGATTYRSQDHTITDNDFIDCQGIATLGASNLVVENNRGKRVRGRFFMCGYSSSWLEGNSTFTNILVANNNIRDCLDVSSITGKGTYHNLFDVDPVPLNNESLNGEIGEPIVGVGGIPVPWGRFKAVGENQNHAGGWHVKFTGNTFTRTMREGPYIANEDGALMFTSDGYINPYVVASELTPQILLGSGLRDVSFEDNDITGFSGLRFFFGDDDDGFRRIRFKGNAWSCASGTFMIGYGGSGARDKLDVTFEGDTFNGDPFLEAPGHSVTGAWTSETELRVFNLPACTGLKVFGCHFKNVSVIQPQSGTYVIADCFQYGEFYSTSFDTANKGVGRPLPWDQARQIPQDSDSRNATWGMELHGQVLATSSVPTSGNYMPGARLKWTGAGAFTPDANGMLIRELIRVTACNAANDNHVLGTDWVYGYVSTASPAV